MEFIQSLKPSGILSFSPESEAIDLTSLNVLIGPNGSGKSNLIEIFELLRATPTGFAAAIRDGGGAREWLWKGNGGDGVAKIEAVIAGDISKAEMLYRLCFTVSGQRTEVTDEVIEETQKRIQSESDVYFYYRYQGGRPVINVRELSDSSEEKPRVVRHLERQSLLPDESVLSQRKDPDLYPELTWIGRQFARIQSFREWSFGRYANLRQPQPADLPTDVLLPDSRNLG